ncbi:unnamed protein product, partial [Brassica rapa subsp. narinosa]
MKQRCISSYFTHSCSTSFTNEQLTEMVIQLKTQMKQLHQLIKRKKKRSHGTQSSFHTLMSRRKKSDTPDDTSQPEPLPLNDDVPNDQDVGAMETNGLPESQSPISSKYAAQLHHHSTKTRPKPLLLPTNNSPPPTSLVVSSPVANPIIHTPIVHDSHDHPSPTVHISREHNAESDHVSPIYITTIHHPPADTDMIKTNQNSSTNHPSDDLERPPTPVTLKPATSLTTTRLHMQGGELEEAVAWKALIVPHMEILIHMLAARHSTQLAREYATFTTPFLAIFIEDIWVEFKRSRKKATFSWDERLVDIVLPPRMKEIDDIHTVYTPMIWNDSHWNNIIDKRRMTGSCEQLSWVGSWKKPDDSPSSVRSDFLSLYLYLSLTLSVLTEANPRQSFTSSVAETEKTEEEECGSEDIGATVVCSCETLMNHLTNCGFQSTPRGERV